MISSAYPLIAQGIRRYPLPPASRWTTNSTTRYYELLALWKKNFSRLYARRILEIAAASAAATVYKTKLEARIEKPSQWQDWEARDWEETALSTMGKSKFSRFLMAAKRVVQLGLLTSPLLVLGPLSYVSPTAKDYSWKYALWGIENAGPTWIKLVQWASTRQDLFSAEFCQYFGKLRDDTIGHSWKETQQILERELGDVASALEIDPTCIGSGCIAQVYRGKLMKATQQYPAGTAVAIKVQHPNIWDKVCMDFYVLLKLAKWLEAIPKLNLEYLSLRDTVRQFRDIMLPQLDLTLEADHLRRFNRDFASDEQVSFPRPMRDLTTPQVLVETFVEGTPVIEYTKGDVPYNTRKQLAHLGLQTTLKMIFLHDFVHGDLHPGM
jgi:aarF domain-containing kinase